MNGWQAFFYGLSVFMLVLGFITVGIAAVRTAFWDVTFGIEPRELYRGGSYFILVGLGGGVMTWAAFALGSLVK